MSHSLARSIKKTYSVRAWKWRSEVVVSQSLYIVTSDDEGVLSAALAELVDLNQHYKPKQSVAAAVFSVSKLLLTLSVSDYLLFQIII